jgi:hypothetical protein
MVSTFISKHRDTHYIAFWELKLGSHSITEWINDGNGHFLPFNRFRIRGTCENVYRELSSFKTYLPILALGALWFLLESFTAKLWNYYTKWAGIPWQ